MRSLQHHLQAVHADQVDLDQRVHQAGYPGKR
jgi:hypothetical protein